MHCGLGSQQSQLESGSQKYGYMYVLGYVSGKSKEHEKKQQPTIIILAFYRIDPFPMFLVKDHFSCKYAPQ